MIKLLLSFLIMFSLTSSATAQDSMSITHTVNDQNLTLPGKTTELRFNLSIATEELNFRLIGNSDNYNFTLSPSAIKTGLKDTEIDFIIPSASHTLTYRLVVTDGKKVVISSDEYSLSSSCKLPEYNPNNSLSKKDNAAALMVELKKLEAEIDSYEKVNVLLAKIDKL